MDIGCYLWVVGDVLVYVDVYWCVVIVCCMMID